MVLFDLQRACMPSELVNQSLNKSSVIHLLIILLFLIGLPFSLHPALIFGLLFNHAWFFCTLYSCLFCWVWTWKWKRVHLAPVIPVSSLGPQSQGLKQILTFWGFFSLPVIDLCTKECGWVQKVVQDLIPWDAGTDSGVTYEVRVRLEWWVTNLPERLFLVWPCSGCPGHGGESGPGSVPDELTVW